MIDILAVRLYMVRRCAMNINKVLMEYDNMFGVSSMVEIEDFLLEMLYKANEEFSVGNAL